MYSYRQVYESFLKDVVKAYKSGTGPIFDAVDRLNTEEQEAFRNAAAARYPDMSIIEETVRIPAMLTAVCEHFHFEQDMVYPVISSDLYDSLANAINDFKQIPVSDMATDIYKRFLCVLGKRYSQTVVEYSEMDASTYADEQMRKQTRKKTE